MRADRLDAAVRAVCPIHGVSVGLVADKATWRIDPAGATPAQLAAGQAVIDSFDPSDPSDAAWLDAQNPDRTTLRQQATAAIQDNNTFLAIASPNNAAVTAQVKRLTQECTAIIKRLIQID